MLKSESLPPSTHGSVTHGFLQGLVLQAPRVSGSQKTPPQLALVASIAVKELLSNHVSTVLCDVCTFYPYANFIVCLSSTASASSACEHERAGRCRNQFTNTR